MRKVFFNKEKFIGLIEVPEGSGVSYKIKDLSDPQASLTEIVVDEDTAKRIKEQKDKVKLKGGKLDLGK